MTPEPQTHLLQVCRTCGGGAPVDVHFCPSCTKILTIGRQGDYFSFLGLARKLTIDPQQIEQQFRTLSRQFHPDFFYNATPAERRASLERSSYLNDAYRTLKQPAARVAYLLELEGVLTSSEHERAKQVPASLLEEVFALNEELDEVREMRAADEPEARWRAKLASAAAPIELKRAEHEAQLAELSARWDALPDDETSGRQAVLVALRDRVLERNYINNLLATIEREATGQGGPQL
jgi:molecular chaperone HscB